MTQTFAALGVGTSANDGTGATLRSAIQMLNKIISKLEHNSGLLSSLAQNTYTTIYDAGSQGGSIYLVFAGTVNGSGRGMAIMCEESGSSGPTVMEQWTSGTDAITFQGSGSNIQVQQNQTARDIAWTVLRIAP